MNKWIQNVLRGQIASSVLYIALGVILLVLPEASLKLLCIVAGAGLLLMGVIRVLIYLKNKENGFLLDLFGGVLFAFLGALILMKPDIIAVILPRVLGTIIVLDSIWTFRVCFEMRRMNFVRWNWLFVITCLFVILGGIMIYNPFSIIRSMMIFTGIILLLNGLLDVFFLIFLKQKDKILLKIQQEMIIATQNASIEGEIVDVDIDEEGRAKPKEDIKVESDVPADNDETQSEIIIESQGEEA